MKTALRKTKHSRNLTGVFGCLMAFALSACNSSDSNPAGPGGGNATLVGRMENSSMAKSASGVQGVVVTAFNINADGSRGSEVGRDTTDIQGNFQIQTALQGRQNWVLVAAQGNMEWMTRYNDTLTANDEDTTRPINFQSTLQTQAYLNLQKNAQGRQVSSGEITAAVDLNVAASNRAQYVNGDSSTRSSMVAHLSAEISAQSQARSAYLAQDNAQYAADSSRASASIRRAESNLTLALHSANGDSAQTRQAEKAYLQAMISAYASGSDSSALSYSRSSEAAYHATLMATASYTDSTRSSMRKRSFYIAAMASDTAMQRQYRRANASSTQLQAVATAGATFQTGADTARSDVSRDSVMARYRASLRTVFQSQGASSDSSFIALLNISSTGVLATTLNGYSASLQNALTADATSSNASGMGQHMQSYDAQAQSSILASWQTNTHNTGNADRNSAMAQIMAYLSVSSNSSHTGT